MADVTDRDGKEAKLVRVLMREFNRARLQLLGLIPELDAYMVDVAPEFWADHRTKLTAAVSPQLSSVFVAQAETMGLKQGDRILTVLLRARGRIDKTYLGPLKLIRRVDGKVRIFDISMKRIIKEGQLEDNVLVEDGDIIFVPQHPMREVERFLSLLTAWVPTYFVAMTLKGQIEGMAGN